VSYGDRLPDQMDDSEFEDRLACAYRSKFLSASDRDFLSDIDAKHDEWGDEMFFSEAQARYLRMLSVRGGYRPATRGATA
jgi:hypothetical protein